ncbi:MAG: hypothetical protein ACRD3M_00630, partial [Thermoanaerobaculia bacterium]
YYGRLFLNVRGREPQGALDPRDYEKVRTELIEKIQAIEDPQGKNLGSTAYRPEALYRQVNGVAPDLIVYFGDLNWRSIGSVGSRSLYTFDNDTGPDGVNHDWHGIFVMNALGCQKGGFPTGRQDPLRLYDVGPTVLAFLGLEAGAEAVGRPMIPDHRRPMDPTPASPCAPASIRLSSPGGGQCRLCPAVDSVVGASPS